MAKFPRVKCRRLVAVLRSLGYELDRQKGSHRTFKAPDRRNVLISYADGDDVPPGVSRKTLAELAGLGEDEAVRLLEGR